MVIRSLGIWGIERGTQNCFLVEVEQSDAANLLPLISEWILPGTHIVYTKTLDIYLLIMRIVFVLC